MPNARDVCDERHTNANHVRQVQKQMPDPATLYQVAEIFAALAVPTRARIVFALSQAELCVCDLAELADMSMSAVSHQLRLLRQLGLVKYRKEGRLAYYSLDDEHASGVLAQVLEHVRHRGAALRVPSRTAFKTRLPRRPRIRSKGPH
ncbi:MAG: metalloregulator ArsR/SmtB family transcription factor [Chloroflexi bacterium]|nr:metalloregulator ArsR/SmtB family transcription factor [Chloroflexota bacterium]